MKQLTKIVDRNDEKSIDRQANEALFEEQTRKTFANNKAQAKADKD